MIQRFLRSSAWPNARASRSPAIGAAGDSSIAGLATARRTTGFCSAAWSTLERQNAKRIAHSRRRHDSTKRRRLHSIKVAAGLISAVLPQEVAGLAIDVTLC